VGLFVDLRVEWGNVQSAKGLVSSGISRIGELFPRLNGGETGFFLARGGSEVAISRELGHILGRIDTSSIP
jgi:hypothetical protein